MKLSRKELQARLAEDGANWHDYFAAVASENDGVIHTAYGCEETDDGFALLGALIEDFADRTNTTPAKLLEQYAKIFKAGEPDEG